jgi:GDP/UDP-N,N'-diacetylbacillosamine 2-epimerase (hydrolysing)
VVARKICVVTGTRAEYGLLRYLMQVLRDAEDLHLKVVATGMHLSPEFGLTYREIEADGFTIDRKVEMLLSSDTAVGIAKATGLGMIGFADAISELSPDLIVVLGDRFEILAAVVAALYAKVPVAHIHGGETTRGAFDEGIRHAITKMSHLHFVAAEEYRKRVIQLGEDPKQVYFVGGLGVDGIKRTPLLDQHELEKQLGFQLGKRNLLITYHPVTLEKATAETQLSALFEALDTLEDDFHFIFTLPNADTEGRRLIEMVQEFVGQKNTRAAAFTSLGQIRYWSVMKLVDAVVGNSSSGLLEAPSLKTATVDIGDRQTGRLACDSVIHCEPTKSSICEALLKAVSPDFQTVCADATNPYGNGGATEKIVEVLRTSDLSNKILKKQFHDLY